MRETLATFSSILFKKSKLLNKKPGLHEPQLQVEWSVKLVSSIVVKLKARFTRTTTASSVERFISLFSCGRATLLTWSLQRRCLTSVEEINVTLLSTGC